MVKILIKTAAHLHKLKYDLKIVPVCINYDRIFDATYISEETLNGEFQPGTTLVNVVQKIFSMNPNKLGKVFVKYCEPIDVNQYLEQQIKEQKMGFNHEQINNVIHNNILKH